MEILNLAMNRIEDIGQNLNKIVNLKDLNLSGNKISNIKEVLKLKRLESLEVISFFDPHFGENPICKIYNYQVLNQL